MIDISKLNAEERRQLLKELLPQAVKDLSEDDEKASHHKLVKHDLESLIHDIKDDEYRQYFGEKVTVYKNRQGTKDHPKSFLCYITIPEAKLLRSLGLGYSYNKESKEWEQHIGKHGIPSFQGGDGQGIGASGEADAAGADNGGDGGGYNPNATPDSNESLDNPDMSAEDMFGGGDSTSDEGRTLNKEIAPAEEVTMDYDINVQEPSTFNENGISSFNTLDGVTVENSWGFDTHYTLNGVQFSIREEIAADTLDILGIGINQKTMDITKDIQDLALGFALGAPTLSLGLKALSISSNLAAYNGHMNASTNETVQTAIGLLSIAYSATSSLKGFSLGMEAIDAGYTGIGLALATTSAYGMYSSIQEMSSLMGTAWNSPSFASPEHNSGNSHADIIKTIQDHAQRKREKTRRNKAYYTRFLTYQVYDYLAGGTLYNASLPAGGLFNPLGIAAPLAKGVGLKPKAPSFALAKRLGFHYSHLAGNTQKGFAGDDNFNPLTLPSTLYR